MKKYAKLHPLDWNPDPCLNILTLDHQSRYKEFQQAVNVKIPAEGTNLPNQ
jgi:hypothetical protein